MTVSELIEQLENYPGDMRVLTLWISIFIFGVGIFWMCDRIADLVFCFNVANKIKRMTEYVQTAEQKLRKIRNEK